MKSPNLKQFICLKIQYLKIVGIYKNICQDWLDKKRYKREINACNVASIKMVGLMPARR